MIFPRQLMTTEEMLQFIAENKLMEDVCSTINNNRQGYAIKSTEAEIVELDGKAFMRLEELEDDTPDGRYLIQIPELAQTEYAENYIAGSRHKVIVSRKNDEFNILFAIGKNAEEEDAKLAEAIVMDYLESCNIDNPRKLKYMMIQAGTIQPAS